MALAKAAIVNQGHLIFDTVIRGFDAAGVELPEQRYLAPGQAPPIEDEQFTVHLASITAGHPGTPVSQWQRTPAAFRTATWQILILRAISTQGTDGSLLPDPIDVQGDAEATWTDAAVLQDLLEMAKVNRVLTRSGVPITISPVVPVGPDGGLAGTRATVGIALEGEPAR